MRATVIVLAALTWLGGCATAPDTDLGKAALVEEANAALAQAKRNDSTLAPVLDAAKGLAVFPTVGKGGAGIGGAFGRGVLFEGGSVAGYCSLSQATIGFQLGGQSYTEIIAFQTPEAVANFKTGHFAFDAQASAVAVKSGSGANAKYSSGVAVFTMNEAGLMYEATIGGQKFGYQAK